MKRRKDLERMSAIMMKIKSPLKLQTDEPKDKKVVASSSDVKLKDEPEEDPAKSKMYQKIIKDKKELEEQQRLEKIARQTTGTSEEFNIAPAKEKLRLLLANRDGVIPENNTEDKK